jgi:hypothetical protein
VCYECVHDLPASVNTILIALDSTSSRRRRPSGTTADENRRSLEMERKVRDGKVIDVD